MSRLFPHGPVLGLPPRWQPVSPPISAQMETLPPSSPPQASWCSEKQSFIPQQIWNCPACQTHRQCVGHSSDKASFSSLSQGAVSPERDLGKGHSAGPFHLGSSYKVKASVWLHQDIWMWGVDSSTSMTLMEAKLVNLSTIEKGNGWPRVPPANTMQEGWQDKQCLPEVVSWAAETSRHQTFRH